VAPIPTTLTTPTTGAARSSSAISRRPLGKRRSRMRNDVMTGVSGGLVGGDAQHTAKKMPSSVSTRVNGPRLVRRCMEDCAGGSRGQRGRTNSSMRLFVSCSPSGVSRRRFTPVPRTSSLRAARRLGDSRVAAREPIKTSPPAAQ